jgi:hypothetical protein
MPVVWHGRLMVLARPLLIIVARFFIVTPRQNWLRQLDNRRGPHGLHPHRAWFGIAKRNVHTAAAGSLFCWFWSN